MSNALILVAVIVVALAIGLALRARDGRVSAVAPTASESTTPGTTASALSEPGPTAQDPLHRMLRDAGLNQTGPTILHFSATWCGPCAAVRRVVEQTITTLADDDVHPLDLELDIDENPSLAKELKVMSLPTTFIYDASGAQTHRIAGVPKADALRAALLPSD